MHIFGLSLRFTDSIISIVVVRFLVLQGNVYISLNNREFYIYQNVYFCNFYAEVQIKFSSLQLVAEVAIFSTFTK